MDNITHSLAGLVAGELIDRVLPSETDPEKANLRRKLILFSSFAANNFPDLDFVLNPLMPEPLAYLLLHRGHTHTILWLVPQLILIFLLIWTLRPSVRKILREDSITRRGVVCATFLGLLLHIGLDYFNSYGVHPFHPLDSSWYYGDLVFIIEPFFWVALGTGFFLGTGKIFRWGGIGLLITASVLFVILGYLHPMALLSYAMAGAVLYLLHRKRQPRSLLVPGASLILALIFVVVQAISSRVMRNKLALSPQMVDVSLTAFPSHPLCWIYHSVELQESEGKYALENGIASVLPSWVPASSCPEKFLAGKTPLRNGAQKIVLREFSVDLQRFRELAQTNCFFSAWLRFSRVPLLQESSAHDLRFSRGKNLGNFSTIYLPIFQGQKCPEFVPGWAPPRKDLLTGRDLDKVVDDDHSGDP